MPQVLLFLMTAYGTAALGQLFFFHVVLIRKVIVMVAIWLFPLLNCSVLTSTLQPHAHACTYQTFYCKEKADTITVTKGSLVKSSFMILKSNRKLWEQTALLKRIKLHNSLLLISNFLTHTYKVTSQFNYSPLTIFRTENFALDLLIYSLTSTHFCRE